ncbi:Uma2 family endonuclease [Leptolyngbya cf. ectocarpi LEGE 11479]|uniref:Uma2 family endonuclease n=1 Tax=Leptolyngbya cf. ectocarpi LEGE 11479 TaxID=1828722 RepID=A0A928ZYZ7_LEPEC|nr:Uma2 family endonuclease [Leptolyngbya ectocarpi]MBE9070097.1 Uma2 family endonuclease [Leptolyngbya cf. ectocarpi LEGE 11479]
MTVTTYKWTTDRYHQAIQAGVFDEQPVELLRGEIIVMPPEGEPHAYYNRKAGDYLRALLGSRAQVSEAHPITLSGNSEPIPDLAIIKPLGTVYLEHHPYPSDIHWLIEFSNATLTKDLTTKKTTYAEANIQEYWVVNLKAKQLHVFKNLQNGQYTTEEILKTGTISPVAFQDIKIQVHRLMTP